MFLKYLKVVVLSIVTSKSTASFSKLENHSVSGGSEHYEEDNFHPLLSLTIPSVLEKGRVEHGRADNYVILPGLDSSDKLHVLLTRTNQKGLAIGPEHSSSAVNLDLKRDQAQIIRRVLRVPRGCLVILTTSSLVLPKWIKWAGCLHWWWWVSPSVPRKH